MKKIISLEKGVNAQTVANQIAAQGFMVDKVLKELGCIYGNLGTATVEGLKKTKGIKTVENEFQVYTQR